MEAKNITASAPGKLMLFGEHAVLYRHPCIVTAIGRRIKVSVRVISQSCQIAINAPNLGIKNYQKPFSALGRGEKIPKGVRFVETAIKNFFEEYKRRAGLELTSWSEFNSRLGLGSSAAVTVATLYALGALFKIKLSKRELFNLAYKTILEVQGVGSGFDVAAAIWGGTIYFFATGTKIVRLKVKNLPLLVGYSGVKAETASLVHQVQALRQRHPKLVDKIFQAIGLLVIKAKTFLEQARFEDLGELMNLNQGLLDALGVNTPKLATLIFAARENGAWGAKLSGAGGGDCMLALVAEPQRAKVTKALEQAGGRVLKIKIGAPGVRIE